MCGIVGFFSKFNYSPDVLSEMLDTMVHRGPDASGTYTSSGFFGGMRRLSINDIKTGNQPLYNHDRSLVLFYNGEIYNYHQLKRELEAKGVKFRTRSDGEVIIHLFDLIGARAFEQLDGMFAVAIWSENEKKLTLARDIPGEKPLYYAQLPDGGLIYSSELSAFKKHPKMELQLNMQAVWDLPTFLWVPEPNTIYNNVFAIEKSSYLEFDGVEVKTRKFRNRFEDFSISDEDDWDTIVDKTKFVVNKAVKSRLLADVPVGTFLSGGLDSSIVSALASHQLEDLSTFSIGYMSNFKDPYEGYADESLQAEEFSRIIGSEHYTVRVTDHEFKQQLPEFCDKAGQPYAVSSGLGVMSIAKMARELGIKVLLSGDGADELFGGYAWYNYLDNSGSHHFETTRDSNVSMHTVGLSIEEVRAKISTYSGSKQAWAWHYYASEQDKREIFQSEAFHDCSSSFRIFDNYSNREKWQPIDFIKQDRDCYLSNEMMPKLDRMTMAHSVEGRAPFVAPYVLNFVKGLKFEHMVQKGLLKACLREAFSETLPKTIISRPKHGFRVPVDSWLRDEWFDLVQHTFSPSSALVRLKFVGADSFQIAQKFLNDEKRISGHHIFSFIMVNMWLEQQGF